MIAKELIAPKSIAVIGASNDDKKPGGKILKNLISENFAGKLYPVNPKETEIQGLDCIQNPADLPQTDLAVLAIPAKFCLDTINLLINEKGTRGFIILSAGFSEMGDEGKKLEQDIADAVTAVGGTLIGPNCIGVLNTNYAGVFAGPIPKLDTKGIDFASGSGATAVFIVEAAMTRGLSFSSLYSVGNSAQTGVEEVLQYWDETFDPETSSKVKLLYVEQIHKPEMLLKHAASLISKGCKIAAIKAGTTEAGSRAVSSHTGALAGSDSAVDALFKKAGIVRCYSRMELIHVAQVFTRPELQGKNIAIITHAGGPGVMLTDALAKGNMDVPHIEGAAAAELLGKLFHGSSVANPIDFLATGTAEHLGMILDYVDQKFDNIDGAAVIFGTTGLFDVTEVYDVLDDKMSTCKKPIYPILPSIVLAEKEVEHFVSKGRNFFPDEVELGNALAKVYHTPKPELNVALPEVDKAAIRKLIDENKEGYISPESVQALLDAAGIPRAAEIVVDKKEDAVKAIETIKFPLVMKVVGPVHKSDVGGVALNIKSQEDVEANFEKMMQIKDAVGVLMQPMLSGQELFVGASYEDTFGHLILAGMGGIFIEVLKDVSNALSPVSKTEATDMITSLKSYKMIEGVRGQEGVNQEIFADIICRLSALLEAAPEIKEMDLNPLLGKADQVIAVDARVRIEK